MITREVAALGTVARFCGGGTPSKSQASFWNGNIPWVSPKDMWVDEITTAEDKITAEAVRKSATNLVPTDSILCVVRSGILARKFPVALTGREVAINQDIKAIIPGKKLDARYLFYFLRASEPDILAGVTTGATVHRVGTDALKALEIPLPSLEEQRRIVTKLDQAFAAIATATANAEKNLANARDFRDRFLRSLYGHIDAEAVPLGAIAEFRNGLNFTGTSKGEAINIVGVKDFQDNLNVPIESLAIVQTDGMLADIDILKENDILTVRSNGNKALIGRCMIAGRQSQKTSHSGFTIRIRPTSQAVDPQFLCRVLKSPSIREKLVAGGGGANISNLNQKALASLKVPLPSLTNQNEIVAKQDEMESALHDLIASINQKLSALTELKQSLLRRAFAGELAMAVPPVANDNWKTPAFTAHVIALAFRHHLALGTEATFGRVKAQKALHLCESIGGVDMGRVPIKDAAGPNDFQHMLAAEDWATANQFFEFVPRPSGNGYSFKKLARFNAMTTAGAEALKPVQPQLERAIGLIAPMNSEEAELLATVHAAWNNLLLDGLEATEAAIIHEARENWHVAKQKFGDGKFRQAIATIRKKGIVPDGSAKRVGGQEAMLF